jgi:EmrB/QacA subfamily drug resistance transporter
MTVPPNPNHISSSTDNIDGYDLATRRSAFFIALLTSFLVPFVGSSINIALPSIERQFRLDAILLSWIQTSYLLSATVALVPSGRLSDIYGRKRIFIYGIMTFTISSLLSGLSSSANILILFRIFQGIGSAMIFATAMAILISVFPLRERGKVLGINVAAVYIGLSLGPLLGGFLTHQFTWRSIFLINVPLGLIIIFLVVWRLKGEWTEAKGETFDLTGAIIYGVAIITLVYGMSPLIKRGLWLILCGIMGILIFIRWELGVKHPVLEMKLFSTNRVFALSNLAALIHYSATFAVTFLLSLYLQHIKGLSPQTAGLILIFQPLVMALLSPVAGRLSDRIEPRIVATIGMTITTIGLFPFCFINQQSTLFFIIMSLLVLGFGFGLFSSPNTNAIMSSVEKRFYGIASGSVGTMRLLGMTMSMAVASLIFSIVMGRIHITPDAYPLLVKSVRIAFRIFAVLCLGGIFASLSRGSVRSNASEVLKNHR